MTTIQDWLTLHLVPNLGTTGCRRLIEAFGNPGMVLKASRKDLLQVRGIRRNVVDIIVGKPPVDAAKRELKRAADSSVTILTWDSPLYPELLKNIFNAPILLYVKGDPALLDRPGIAVVGSRAATSYGLKIARRMASELGHKGFSVISGLAMGVDAASHAGALDAGATTIAVLGCGVDVSYPQRNAKLAQRIVKSGVIVSEYPFGTKPDAFRFPARNRIINGLALGVLVVEAAVRSGSLITARLALEEGREVFAIPGRVDSARSAGAHRLLQEGAKLVHSVDDIIEEFGGYGLPCTAKNKTVNKRDCILEGDERQIISLLDGYPQHIDTIINNSKLSAEKVSHLLLLLELKDLVEALPGQLYRATEAAVISQ